MLKTFPYAQPQADALTVDDISFSYPNGHSVFSAFSLNAQPGEFVAILGPSGCGKTTLLNLLSGFMQPQSGRITINQTAVRPERSELGYVFQAPQLFPWLSALENVRFGLRMSARIDESQQRAQALQYLRLVGLENAAHRLPHQLSGGMQQRVSLARTLALEPSVLLMDEPFAALDAISRNSMNEETLRIWAELGQTVLFITHDIDEAVFLADRVVVLNIAPGGIHSELEIHLPRPRSNLQTRRLPAFLDYRNELMTRIAQVMDAPQAIAHSTPRLELTA
ncbi:MULTISPECIES: ABC transporter ATP-binding protein [Pseudomonas]|uniref:ABC transporter ATP-binding protein n=1 Tax=Pseudomonas TaxID=286 RepID=UPI00025FF6A8|nr:MULTISPECIES: ABC transporter ATP-binding protein [Pseudomonas]EIK65565.1 ABC transporter, ATP-binding protein [Pseudomonas fluorescens Q8r1-96]RDI07522.1 NitT/TauT family transport system ATP-binding protein [Pseudomonas fluorescens]ALQ03278.1 Ferric iron ABC transporter, ATP-binding protein [Pseudomonas brassicacearum]AOS37936.1 ABC transporter [Pseudomonas brassicacearum]KAB0528112.1 ABC transporter ATP-binding protein [Pseudomonas brassicacearum subsp. brassicacearum]